MAREVRPGLAVEVISFILSFGFCPLSDTISCCAGAANGPVNRRQGGVWESNLGTPRQCWSPLWGEAISSYSFHSVIIATLMLCFLSQYLTNILLKVAIVIHNAGTLGQDGRKITVRIIRLRISQYGRPSILINFSCRTWQTWRRCKITTDWTFSTWSASTLCSPPVSQSLAWATSTSPGDKKFACLLCLN